MVAAITNDAASKRGPRNEIHRRPITEPFRMDCHRVAGRCAQHDFPRPVPRMGSGLRQNRGPTRGTWEVGSLESSNFYVNLSDVNNRGESDYPEILSFLDRCRLQGVRRSKSCQESIMEPRSALPQRVFISCRTGRKFGFSTPPAAGCPCVKN